VTLGPCGSGSHFSIAAPEAPVFEATEQTHSLTSGQMSDRCQNGTVTSPRRPRKEGEAPSPPVEVPPTASSAARQSRLTKQVVFLMLIGWLVVVVLVVVLLSVT
jgi:hypothetical protein